MDQLSSHRATSPLRVLQYPPRLPPGSRRWLTWYLILLASVAGGFLLHVLVPRRTPYYPPLRLSCKRNMIMIGEGISLYANDHGNAFPDSFNTLLANEDLTANVFVCPATNDTPAVGPTTQAVAANLSSGGHLSYAYVGRGLTLTSATPDVVILYDSGWNHGSSGLNAEFGDFRVEWLNAADAASVRKQAAAGVWPIRIPPTTQPAATQLQRP